MPDVSPQLVAKLEELAEQYAALKQQLLDPDVYNDHNQVRAIDSKRAALEPIVERYNEYTATLDDIAEFDDILRDNADPDLVNIARAELPDKRAHAEHLLTTIQKRLVTADDQTVGSIIIELRAGVGGDEAGIWAGDLLDMYTRYAAERGWKLDTLDDSPADMGGFKQAIIQLQGEGVWASLGYEGGTHQVKRVPATEAQGRVHTSTATVAVLPEPEEVDIALDPGDVKEMITTSQGPGGQNVNKVATAVHLIHLPTGIEVRMQETKSQAQNREKAWRLLRARLYERQKAEADAERAEQRASMIGSGARSEKIRTYRYKDNMVVDHRIGESFNLSEVMQGRLQPMIDALTEHDTAQRLAAL
ncbi:MAG: peptide chain release factor 1 [Phycisphaerales bacterium]|nr:peptide chain release factor 1 [Phycisphaerales bacterium]